MKEFIILFIFLIRYFIYFVFDQIIMGFILDDFRIKIKKSHKTKIFSVGLDYILVIFSTYLLLYFSCKTCFRNLIYVAFKKKKKNTHLFFFSLFSHKIQINKKKIGCR